VPRDVFKLVGGDTAQLVEILSEIARMLGRPDDYVDQLVNDSGPDVR
jgi:hypothetical protein